MLIAGLALAACGAVLYLLGRSGFRGLPGDVAYESAGGGLRVYFPIVTCIALSLALTLGLWAWRWLNNRG